VPESSPTSHPNAGRGRPKLHGDDEVLHAALVAFAAAGFEAMSIRSLSRDLGLSHGALHQRFGSKERLFYAATDHGFGGLRDAMVKHLADGPAPSDARGALRAGIRAFLLASAEHPELVRLMNTEGIVASERLDYIFATYITPMVRPLPAAAAASTPTAGGRLSTRELFFLLAHGAAAPLTLQALSDRFDDTDGALDPQRYADHMADVLMRLLDG
jgi:AcrR family transcriptional regulator